ncbi:MAG: hypothetical protein MK193_03810 [Lentisphaeria bacterium]|nr:hypothetical protein [Lentisphaeria bacterium]
MKFEILPIAKDDIPKLYPLTSNRSIGTWLLGNKSISAIQKEIFNASILLSKVTTLTLYLYENVWLPLKDLNSLSAVQENAYIYDADDRLLGFIADSPVVPNKGVNYHCPKASFIHYPWDLLRTNANYHEHYVDDSIIEGKVHEGAHINGTLLLGKGSEVLPGVYIEGTVITGENCRIGPNCYLRGPISLGDKCKIGNACEVKASVLSSGATVGHLSYVGDSILGEKVNFGAGTITSNYRHDASNHKSMIEGTLIDTGRRKFGTIIGDHVHTGIHTSIYPGRKLWPGVTTVPAEVVRKDIKA